METSQSHPATPLVQMLGHPGSFPCSWGRRGGRLAEQNAALERRLAESAALLLTYERRGAPPTGAKVQWR